MKVFKFSIHADEQRHVHGVGSYSGCLAAAVAEDEAAARAVLHADALAHGDDARWLDVAVVTEIDLVPGAVIAWAMI